MDARLRRAHPDDEAEAAGHQQQVRSRDRIPVQLTERPDRIALRGVFLAAGGAFAYGVTVVLNRALARAGLNASTVLGVRFGVAALVLLMFAAAGRRSLVPVRGERMAAALLGGVGYMAESTLFFMGLERGTTVAVALIFYTYPAFVTLAEAALARRWLDRLTSAALVAAGAGTAIVVAGSGELEITTSGMVFALGAALSFAAYLMTGARMVSRTDARVAGAWVAGGAALAFLTQGALLGSFSDPTGRWAQLVGNGVATAAAFGLMFAALQLIGSGPTAVVMTLEAVFAVVLAAVFLGEGLSPLQVTGGLLVLAAAALMSRRREVADVETELPTVP